MYTFCQKQYKCFVSIDFCSLCNCHFKFKALQGFFNDVLLCSRQALALGGQTDESSNFQQIINLIAKHKDMQAKLTRQNTCKWLSHDIMNEMIYMQFFKILGKKFRWQNIFLLFVMKQQMFLEPRSN